MKTEELLGLGVPLLFLLLLFVEGRRPARPYEAVPRWGRIGAAFFVLTLVVGSITPFLLPSEYLKSHRILDLSGVGLWALPIGVLATTFFGYWLHRAEHCFGWLWRATHQLHHSPVRVDMLGAFYTHPLEVMIKVALGTLLGTFLLGLSPVASAGVGLATAALSMFQHWNIRTPPTLGYFVQRPESHCLHHERNVHARNYGDLPIWDMMFGTFHNPKGFEGKLGFDNERSARLTDMLFMKDVNQQNTRTIGQIHRKCCL